VKKGSLIIVGTGIRLGAHCTPESEAALAAADIVFAVVDPLTLQWLKCLNPNVVCMQSLYAPLRSRRDTYERMTQTMLEAVRSGKSVCGAFYGHPGVFVLPSRLARRQAREEGYEALMLPGVSAEDCLFADLGVDPGSGWQSYEAHDFFIHARKVDPTAPLVLWQISVVGDAAFTAFDTDPQRLRLLAEALSEIYPITHEVVVYEAATLPVHAPSIERLALGELHLAKVSQSSTLFIPALLAPTPDLNRLAKLTALEDAQEVRKIT